MIIIIEIICRNVGLLKLLFILPGSVDKTMVSEKPTTNKPTAPDPGKESPSTAFYKLSVSTFKE